jgi:hypothetical protein
VLARNPIRIIVGGLIALVLVGFGVYRLVNRAGGAVNSVSQATGGSSGTNAADGSSLIRAKNFAKAITAVGAKSGQVLEVRLEPATAKFQVRRGQSGSAQGFAYTSGGDLNSFGVKLIGPGRIQDNVFPLAQLKATTPEKIVAAIHARNASLSLKDVQFMLLELDAGTGKFVWNVNIGTPGSGSLYQANLNGSNVALPGESAARAASSGAVRPPAVPSNAQDAVARAQRVAKCIQSAGGDVTKIQACTK